MKLILITFMITLTSCATRSTHNKISSVSNQRAFVEIDQDTLLERASQTKTESFFKTPILVYLLETENKMEEIPVWIKDVMGEVDYRNNPYTDQTITDSGAVALQIAKGKPDFYPIGTEDFLEDFGGPYVKSKINIVKEFNSDMYKTLIESYPNVKNLIRKSKIIAVKKNQPIAFWRLSSLGYPVDTEVHILKAENNGEPQIKPLGQDGFVTKNRDGTFRLVNVDPDVNSNFPIAHISDK